MKFNKKILSIFFIALLAIVLVACGGTTTTEAPTTEAPTTEAPTTVAPTTEAPTTVAPTTEAPTTSAPIDWVAIEASLRADYSETLDNDEFVATTNLTLISVIGDATITWSSSNTAYLGHDGVIVQPSYALGDQTVILTATLAIGEEEHEVMFFVTIDALAKTDLERATEALATVMIFPFKEKWTEADSDSLVLLAVAKDAENVEYPVVWTSSNPVYISAEGVITQPAETEEDVVVTLTATITINTVEYTSTKDFTVAKKVGATVVTSIADAIALGVDAYVEIQGVTFIGKVTSGGYYFTDGTDLIYAYTFSLPVVIGDVVDLKGVVDEYYGYTQLASGTDMPIVTTVSTEPVSVFVPTVQTIAYIMENATAADGDMKIATAYTVTGRVYYASAYADPVFLVPSDYDFVNNFAADAKPIGDALEIYDYSNDELLIPFHGQEVTIVLIPLGYHSTHANHYAYFIGSAEDIVVTIEDDATAVATALDSLTYPTTIVADTTLDLPASLFGVTLTYESNNAAINATTGFVDAASQTIQQTVTLTVTATRGAVTDTKVFTIKVGELQVSTLAEALAGATNDLFKVHATIIGGGYGTYYIQDATGAMAVYVASDLRTFFSENVGQVIELVGTRDTYNGLNQLRATTATVVEAGTLPAAVNVNGVVDLLPYQNQLIELVAMEVLSTSTDSYGNISLSLKDLVSGITVAARWDSRFTIPAELNTTLTGLVVGDVINMQAILSWYNNPQISITAETVITMTTDAEKLAADASFIPTTVETTSGSNELILLEGPYGSTIVWDMATIVAVGGTYDPVTGAAVMPSVEVNTDYAVTATLSLGTETDVVVNVVVTVLAMTDADKLAAAIADTGIDQDCDGYQVVTLPTTGLYGTTITWAYVSGEATLDGAVITYNQTELAGTVVLDATFVNGTANQVVTYTINVTPVTIVTDFATLSAMTDGVNYDIPNDTYIYIQGVVSANSYDGLFLQDASGLGMFLYRPDSDSTMVVGDEVVYYGKLASYSGARQLASGADLMDLVSSGNTPTVNIFTVNDMLTMDGTEAGMLISFTGLTVKAYDGTTVSFNVTDSITTREIRIRYYTNFATWLPDIYPVGSILPEVQFVLYNFRDGFAQLDMLAIELTDTQAIGLDADALPATLSLSDDYVVPTPLYGSTYTVTGITGDAAAFLDYTTTAGTILVTLPEDADKVGQITIQVTLGTETPIDVVVDVTVKLPEPPAPVFFSEYGEGSSNNKWLEIYNGTGAVLDLTGYTVELYSNGATTASQTLVLTGTVAIGDVYVITNASTALAAVIAASDITSAVTFFNGDDAIALLKDGVVVDVFGVIGVDPGTSWLVGTGDTVDNTLVRKSTVTGPTTTWDANEWDVYAIDTETYVGAHTIG